MFRSIRGSLQAWHAAILATVLAAFGCVVFHLQRQSTLQQIDAELNRTAEFVAAGLRPGRPRPRDVQRPEPARDATESNERSSTKGIADGGPRAETPSPATSSDNERAPGSTPGPRPPGRRGER